MNEQLDLSNRVIIPDMFRNIDVGSLFAEGEDVFVNDHSNFTPHELLKDFMKDVKNYWLNGCEKCEYEDESFIQCTKSAMVLLYALMKFKEREELRQQLYDNPYYS